MRSSVRHLICALPRDLPAIATGRIARNSQLNAAARSRFAAEFQAVT
jgi:hypothetical protein